MTATGTQLAVARTGVQQSRIKTCGRRWLRVPSPTFYMCLLGTSSVAKAGKFGGDKAPFLAPSLFPYTYVLRCISKDVVSGVNVTPPNRDTDIDTQIDLPGFVSGASQTHACSQSCTDSMQSCCPSIKGLCLSLGLDDAGFSMIQPCPLMWLRLHQDPIS